jgi:hypothetical protein
MKGITETKTPNIDIDEKEFRVLKRPSFYKINGIINLVLFLLKGLSSKMAKYE